jgi:Flp pilus assembly protein TadD
MRLGVAQANAKDYQGALSTLHGAMTSSPRDVSILTALAAVYLESGQIDAGLADARKWQKQTAMAQTGYELEGELLTRAGKYPEAETAFRSALARGPSSFAATRLHSAQLASGKASQAAGDAAKWLKEHPQDFSFISYLSETEFAAKDYKSAEAHLRAALELQPDNPTVLNNLAWAQLEQRDPKALATAERAYLLAPMSAEVINTYGTALVQNGKTGEGIAFLRRSVDLAPADPVKRLGLGKALIKTGDKSGARKELEIVAGGAASPVQAEASQLLKGI